MSCARRAKRFDFIGFFYWFRVCWKSLPGWDLELDLSLEAICLRYEKVLF